MSYRITKAGKEKGAHQQLEVGYGFKECDQGKPD